MGKYRQIIPEKLYSELETVSNLLAPTIPRYSVDDLKQIISVIASHLRKDETEQAEATPIKMNYLRNYVWHAEKYIWGLMNLGILKRSAFYVPGETSYKYNFYPQYRGKFIAVPLNNPKLQRRIEKAQREFLKEASKSVRGHSEQTSQLKKLKIDPAYAEFIDKYFSGNIDKYNYNLGAAVRIENGEFFYSIDKTSGRFHSNVTNLSKDLRQFLRVNNQPLVNIDIKNSQPYFSTIILTNPSKVSWMAVDPTFQELLTRLEVSFNDDVQLYIKLMAEGEIYEYLRDKFNEVGMDLTRASTKRQVLRILYARNRMPAETINKKCREIFIENFPTVHQIFSKVRGDARGNKFQNFKRFAILLQKIESFMMLSVILKRIRKELPGTIAITIHDSVMTSILTNQKKAVREIIETELEKFVGIKPKLGIEGIKIEGIEEEKEGTGYRVVSNTMAKPL